MNHLTAGRVPGGGLVQVPQRVALPSEGDLQLTLAQADYVSASQLAISINNELGPGTAHAVDAGTVAVKVPTEYRGAITDLMAQDRAAPGLRGHGGPGRHQRAHRHGGRRLERAHQRRGGRARQPVGEDQHAASTCPSRRRSPNGGETVVVPQQEVDVEEGDAKLVALQEGTTLDAVVRALNELGATPRDIIAIMQALRAAGALRAEIVII